MPRKEKRQTAGQPQELEPICTAVERVIQDAQERQPGEEPERKYPLRRGWHKHERAGVQRFENRSTKPWQAEIEFKEKPDAALMDALRPVLKEAGFHWDKHAGDHGAWVKPIRYNTQAADRLDAENAFRDIIALKEAHQAIDGKPAEQGMAR